MKKFIKILFAKPPPAKKGEVNFSFIDRFTFAHFLIGFAYMYFGLGFFVVFLLAVFWELIENPLKFHFPSIFPHSTADTLQNMLGDCLAVILGAMLSRYLYF